jgi:hypothetical protein
VLPARCTCCPPKGPKLEQVKIPYDLSLRLGRILGAKTGLAFEKSVAPAVLPQNGRLPLTADKAAGFNPEITWG